ncbi:MAG: hypothetical protein FJ368_03175 [Pelagibacterales bacterium]|nr:hypothetical protein [Pelagibacterales bacterium]
MSEINNPTTGKQRIVMSDSEIEKYIEEMEWKIHCICGYDIDRQLKLVKALNDGILEFKNGILQIKL